MSLFYTRNETENEVTIVFTALAARMYSVFGLFFLLLYLTDQSPPGPDSSVFLIPLVIFLLFLVTIVYTVAFWKPMKEVRQALKKGEVRVSGSRWSFRNPRTIVIPKNT